jgi:hypothetical protein
MKKKKNDGERNKKRKITIQIIVYGNNCGLLLRLHNKI